MALDRTVEKTTWEKKTAILNKLYEGGSSCGDSKSYGKILP